MFVPNLSSLAHHLEKKIYINGKKLTFLKMPFSFPPLCNHKRDFREDSEWERDSWERKRLFVHSWLSERISKPKKVWRVNPLETLAFFRNEETFSSSISVSCEDLCYPHCFFFFFFFKPFYSSCLHFHGYFLSW